MYNINKLLSVDFLRCFDLIKLNQNDLKYFKFLGWNTEQFEKQFFKDNFYGLGLFFDNILVPPTLIGKVNAFPKP